MQFIFSAVGVYQLCISSVYWQYISEITCDAATGLSIFTLMFVLIVDSFISQNFISQIGIVNLLYVFGGYQIIAIIVLVIMMKDTRGLSPALKKTQFSN